MFVFFLITSRLQGFEILLSKSDITFFSDKPLSGVLSQKKSILLFYQQINPVAKKTFLKGRTSPEPDVDIKHLVEVNFNGQSPITTIFTVSVSPKC